MDDHSIAQSRCTIIAFGFEGKEVYFVESGVGEIRAAESTQLLIDRFGVEAIINFGVVGGLKGGMRGRVYRVSGVVHYDFDTFALDGASRGRYEHYSSAVIPTDARILELIGNVAPYSEPVVCASGDKFVADAAFKEGLTKEFGASVCEMESAGILLTADRSGVPCGFVKIVSDDGEHSEEFNDFISRLSDEFSSIIIPLIKAI